MNEAPVAPAALQANDAEDASPAPMSLPATKSAPAATKPQVAAESELRPTAKAPTPASPREEAPEAMEAPRPPSRSEAAKEAIPGHELLADAEAPKLAPKVEAKVPLPVAQAAPPTSFASLAKTEAAALPVAPNPTMAQLEGGVKWMLRAGAPEAQLQLHPESLGQVSIHLKVEDGQVHARLWVSEPASVQAIQDGRVHLEQSLRQQGLQLGSFDLQQGRQPQRGAAFPPASSRVEREMPPEAPRVESLPAALARPGTSRRIELIA
jgi:flagellar hook-length control protein FliK